MDSQDLSIVTRLSQPRAYFPCSGLWVMKSINCIHAVSHDLLREIVKAISRERFAGRGTHRAAVARQLASDGQGSANPTGRKK
jgi:hypothetical protein